ncbi:MAG TPA: sigma-54 dependent transcriptional regulator [Chitinophagaceae bacterium]|nr:sigma-54 dependent transcriptional regulator [Chitinophagaceae bacterium]
MTKLLVIDDDISTCDLLQKFLTKHGFTVITTTTAKKAMEYLDDIRDFDLILCDLRLENGDGKDILLRTRELYPNLPVVIITGYNDLKTAVNIMKLGAYDYILKPLIPDEMLATINHALNDKAEKKKPPAEPASPQEEMNGKVFGADSDYISGHSKVFQTIMEQMLLVAPTDYSVIIYGESGSGKEAIAQEIHKRSKRKNYPFIAIDCGALSKELAGSELFGHEKGAFTGAVNQKTGSFEVANKGTIFLDEIGNLSYDIQVSLLRVIQERKMRRVGGTTDIELDVRLIIASNEELWSASQKGKFREDLFHRLNEFNMKVPPLRERREDIMLFAKHFLEKANNTLHKQIKGFSPDVENIFKNYPWYGNLRELKNVVKRTALLADGEYIEARFLPFEICNYQKLFFEEEERASATSYSLQPEEIPFAEEKILSSSATTLKGAMIDMEYQLILKTLAKCNFNKSKAAKMLKIDRRTLYNKMNLYRELNNR